MLYEGRAAIPADTTQSVTLLLKRNAFRFKPYGCQQLADSVHIPPYDASPILEVPGSQYAFLIRDSTGQPPHKLQTVTFRIGGRDGLPREPFRLRIYQYSGHPQAPPGNDLLLENFIVWPLAKEGIITYDVSSYDIMVSGAGFFLAMEYVDGDFHGFHNTIPNYTPTGPVLRPPCTRTDIRTWEDAFGKGWHRATSVENCWPLYESALSVEVESTPGPARAR